MTADSHASPGWELVARWPGGTVSALTRTGGPGDPTLALAATAAGLHSSADGGRSWAWIGLGPAPIPEAVAASSALADDRIVLLGTVAGLFRSTDGGRQWRPTVTGSRVQCIEAAPDFLAGGVVLAGTESDGILRSEDGGLDWSGANAGLLDLNVTALALSPVFVSDRTAFAGTTSGLYRSRNGGRAWRLVEGPEAPVIQALAVSPTFSDDWVVLAGTESDGLFRSDDGGQTWEPVTTFPEPCVTSLSFARGGGDSVKSGDLGGRAPIVAGTAAGVAISGDGGRTWHLEAPELGPILSLTVLDDTVVAGTLNRGMVRLALAEATGSGDWVAANDGLAGLATVGLSVQARPGAQPTIAVATLDSAVLVSTDGGGSWATSSEGLAYPGATSAALVPSTDDSPPRVLATFTDGLFRSDDGGESWQPVALPSGPDAPPSWLGPGGSAVVTAGRGCLALSLDSAETWHNVPLPPGHHDLACAAVSPDVGRDRTVFAVVRSYRPTSDGGLEPAGLELWHTENLGERWSRWLESPTATVMTVAVPPSRRADTSLLVGHAGRVGRPLPSAREVRRGERRPLWQEAQIGKLGSAITALAISPHVDRDRTVIAAANDGVYLSTDAGATFGAWDHSLSVPLVTGLALAASEDGDLVAYALGLGGTLWRRPI